MKIVVSKFGDFNETIRWYKEMLLQATLIHPIRQSGLTVTEEKYNIYSNIMAALRAYASNVSLEVSQINELTENSEIDEIAVAIGGYETFEKIFKRNRMEDTNFNRRQLRNCLAHGDYTFIMNGRIDNEDASYAINLFDIKELKINLKNSKINCDISLSELMRLVNIYEDLYMDYDRNVRLRNIYYKRPIKLRNNADVKKFIDGITVAKFSSCTDMSISDNIDEIMKKIAKEIGISEKFDYATIEYLEKEKEERNQNKFDVKIDRLDERTKKFVNSYLEYLGFEVTKIMLTHDNLYNRFIGDILAPEYTQSRINKYANHFMLFMQSSFMKQLSGKSQKYFEMVYNQLNQENLIMDMHLGPIIYSNVLLGLANYCFSYVRSINDEYLKNNGKNLFLYRDIGTSRRYQTSLESEPIPIERERYIRYKEIAEIQEKIDKNDDRKKLKDVILGKLVTKINCNNLANPSKNREEELQKIDALLEGFGNEKLQKILDILVDKIVEKEPESSTLTKESVQEYLKQLLYEKDGYSYKKDKKTDFEERININDEKLEVKEKFSILINEYIGKKSTRKVDELIPEVIELNSKKEELEKEGKFNDSSEFFRHLRNSIAHGNYTIDYIPAFLKKDFGKMKFHFEDYDKDRGKTEFYFDITGTQLLELVERFRVSINKQLEQTEIAEEFSKHEEFLKAQQIVSGQKIGEATFDVTVKESDKAQGILNRMLKKIQDWRINRSE